MTCQWCPTPDTHTLTVRRVRDGRVRRTHRICGDHVRQLAAIGDRPYLDIRTMVTNTITEDPT